MELVIKEGVQWQRKRSFVLFQTAADDAGRGGEVSSTLIVLIAEVSAPVFRVDIVSDYPFVS
eukprot:CAMPEP_0198239948 /NCGR_PEP_ID=MMETSP1446-20131203/5213_1 /TAXON_ID=1461542 ORGANISM="Unidentified sp, Strain CCMP2111" /NCGR_SAMPLE_ID=MMETSP1446 /ASSEMBLY_ACC=CAM_ASM_001112 /LENGTH=61 /DNA_ID=CAMNT_0043922623 /DNA_START=414 /DNA_END=599 /DNA_ORIENTATION=+